jgi:hypothetical protein
MTDEERVKPTAVRIRPSFWLALGLAILALCALPDMIKDAGVGGGLGGFLFWETLFVFWAYRSIRPYFIVRQWDREGEYEQRNWSPEERGLQRGNMLVYLYRTTNADSSKTVPIEGLKKFGGWTFAELHNLLSPLQETGIVEVKVPSADNLTDLLVVFADAGVSLTPAGVLATEDAVTQARQRPGYSVTIHGNDNQVQVATVSSEQLRNT